MIEIVHGIKDNITQDKTKIELVSHSDGAQVLHY